MINIRTKIRSETIIQLKIFTVHMLTILAPMNQWINWDTFALELVLLQRSFVDTLTAEKTPPEERCQQLYEYNVVIAVSSSSKVVNEFCQRHLFALAVM